MQLRFVPVGIPSTASQLSNGACAFSNYCTFHFSRCCLPAIPFTANRHSLRFATLTRYRIRQTHSKTTTSPSTIQANMARSRSRSRRSTRRRQRSDSRRRSRPLRGDTKLKSPSRNTTGLKDGPMAQAVKQLPEHIVRTRQEGNTWVADVDGATVVCNSSFFCTLCHAKLEGASIDAHVESKKHVARASSGNDLWAGGAAPPNDLQNSFQSAGYLQSSIPYGTTTEEDKMSIASKNNQLDIRSEFRNFLLSPEGQMIIENQVMKCMMQHGNHPAPMMFPPMTFPPSFAPQRPPHHSTSSSSKMDPRLQQMLRPIGER